MLKVRTLIKMYTVYYFLNLTFNKINVVFKYLYSYRIIDDLFSALVKNSLRVFNKTVLKNYYT